MDLQSFTDSLKYSKIEASGNNWWEISNIEYGNLGSLIKRTQRWFLLPDNNVYSWHELTHKPPTWFKPDPNMPL